MVPPLLKLSAAWLFAANSKCTEGVEVTDFTLPLLDVFQGSATLFQSEVMSPVAGSSAVQRVCFVGDHLISEVLPAHRIGWRTIAVLGACECSPASLV